MVPAFLAKLYPLLLLWGTKLNRSSEALLCFSFPSCNWVRSVKGWKQTTEVMTQNGGGSGKMNVDGTVLSHSHCLLLNSDPAEQPVNRLKISTIFFTINLISFFFFDKSQFNYLKSINNISLPFNFYFSKTNYVGVEIWIWSPHFSTFNCVIFRY